jgi:8-oxo-(d)GTP phosphatase
MASSRPAPPLRGDIVAAGGVVLRRGPEVLLVHRPKYDDWSFPKGKLDRGEHATSAAVREVEEETGLRVRLGRPLRDQRYPTSKGAKVVHYWIARAAGSDDVSGYVANAEIDEVAWVPVDKAARLLTYSRDRATLAEALERRKRTDTVIVLRHAESRSRSTWRGDDEERPLLVRGHQQAERLSKILQAYGVRRVLTSPSRRCVDTVAPFCRDTGTEPELVDLLSERGVRPRRLRKLLRAAVKALRDAGPTVVCSHRPVLPRVFGVLGVEDPALEKGEMLVVHLRRGRPVAVERH